MATAEQTVSAVLEATNKAYIVETGDSEDGLSHYRRWSDGTIEQWGKKEVDEWIGNSGSKTFAINFPIPFSSASYEVCTTAETGSAYIFSGAKDLTISSFNFYATTRFDNSYHLVGLMWSAKGK